MEEKLLLEQNTNEYLSNFPTTRLPNNELTIVVCQPAKALWLFGVYLNVNTLLSGKY